jgi:hypothetical protein
LLYVYVQTWATLICKRYREANEMLWYFLIQIIRDIFEKLDDMIALKKL